jgi:hypothetical protein
MSRKAAFEDHVAKCEVVPPRQSYTERVSACIGVAVNAAEESCAGTAASTVTLKVDSLADLQALKLVTVYREDLLADGLEYEGAQDAQDAEAISWVIGVTTSENAFIATFAAPGAVLRKAVEDGRTFSAQQWMEQSKYPALLTFQLKPPPVPTRGYARKASRKAGLQLTAEQTEFLQGQWTEDKKITAYLLKEKMDEKFSKREELQLFEEDVNQWLSFWYSQVRSKGKAKAVEEGEEGWQEGDEAA